MATKTEKPIVTEEPIVTEPVVEDDPWKRYEKVYIPREGKNDEKSHYFAVNGRTFNVPKGKTVEVPEPIAEMVREYLIAQARVTEFEESVPNNG